MRIEQSSIGFGATLPSDAVLNPVSPTASDALHALEPTDLCTYGLIPEFVGRFPVLESTHSLDREQLVQVLTTPKNALIKQYRSAVLYFAPADAMLCRALFAMNGVEFYATDCALTAVAALAIEKKTGAVMMHCWRWWWWYWC
jgi:ATP-dependent Clp protease ATP-binding subunit ClpX